MIHNEPFWARLLLVALLALLIAGILSVLEPYLKAEAQGPVGSWHGGTKHGVSGAQLAQSALELARSGQAYYSHERGTWVQAGVQRVTVYGTKGNPVTSFTPAKANYVAGQVSRGQLQPAQVPVSVRARAAVGAAATAAYEAWPKGVSILALPNPYWTLQRQMARGARTPG